MTSVSLPPPFVPLCSRKLYFSLGSPVIFSFSTMSVHSRLCALKTGPEGNRIGSGEVFGSDLVRKPVVAPGKDVGGILEGKEKSERKGSYENAELEQDSVDWEDKIFEDTVPLVSFVRMILHSGTYESGDRLSAEHERTILKRLLPYHPDCEKKIGCGIDHLEVDLSLSLDYILFAEFIQLPTSISEAYLDRFKIRYHPDFESSRCLFIVRKDGQLVDFSYWKCIKGLIRKNYPLYAETFILSHFRGRRIRY